MNTLHLFRPFLPAIILAAPLLTTHADVTLSPIIGSHMVLQRDMACPIWGWADAGEEVTVEFAGQKHTAKAEADGKWMVKLTPMKANSQGQVMTIRGKNTLSLEDILIGEVWLCSGQSNMEWTVAQSADPQAEIAAANHPRIRHLKVQNPPAFQPEAKVISQAGWQVASPQTAANFTAVGYYFAREIVKALDVPVGLLGANWGGTRIEPWTTPDGFKSVPALKDIADKLDQFPVREERPDRADPSRKIVTAKLQSPLALYNGRIAPLVPYAIRGALWYQGESNNGEGMLYAEKKKALIQGWRKLWSQPEMPFYFVQLAPFNYKGANPENLARIWEAQRATLAVPHTGMAVTTDIGNPADIHPKNKQEVGRRLSLWALAKTYGKKDVVYSGPLFKAAKFDGPKVTLNFDYASGLKTRDGQAPSHFVIAGEDQNFVPAKAEIAGDTVVVSAEGITAPKAVRYGWSHIAEPNLANGAGLPASPFRTDDWPAAPFTPPAPAPKPAPKPVAPATEPAPAVK